MSCKQGQQQFFTDTRQQTIEMSWQWFIPSVFQPFNSSNNNNNTDRAVSPGTSAEDLRLRPLHSLIAAPAPRTASGGARCFSPVCDDSLRIAVQRRAGPEAAAWAGQEAAVELEDMTRDVRRMRRGWRYIRRLVTYNRRGGGTITVGGKRSCNIWQRQCFSNGFSLEVLCIYLKIIK